MSETTRARALATGSGLPEYRDGWLLPDGSVSPVLSTVSDSHAVNWSDQLEDFHEESSRTHFLDRWTRSALLEAITPLAPEASVADLGCSTGHLLEDLRAAHPNATLFGVDLVPAGLLKAHAAVPSARLLHADVCDLPFGDATLDAVVSANLLEHVPDDAAALREVARVLRPGCVAALIVPAGPGTYDYYDRFLGHERRYARGELARRCADAGLRVERDSYIASLLYPAFWLVKQRNRRRFGSLTGDALQRQVSSDIARTNDSRTGESAWRLEARLARLGVSLPFGIRSFVVARRPETEK